ncbi:hypothetical protein CROQUDRAFT_102795 [Cronartium quercuum f. sp. fusiforme G11]|uniref:Uncharacterized protein n=1 Tax=Cronartium quercuum f. sp. fusiforme G11 TaxID=708437 RepID=A0A9P6T4R4_9BASI|nr:hypothetical protein CROQUDRAFT_102795 [Cronartium quercuum f. sp. fusiforme G11]
MPFRNPGSFTQLGGEFCFESRLQSSTCIYVDETPSSLVKAKRTFVTSSFHIRHLETTVPYLLFLRALDSKFSTEFSQTSGTSRL